uniref:Uncharacterized protein n=1 Tax=Micrurus spixii TaxID=129469 RepID=A0A2D4MKZ7_9SAUR
MSISILPLLLPIPACRKSYLFFIFKYYLFVEASVTLCSWINSESLSHLLFYIFLKCFFFILKIHFAPFPLPLLNIDLRLWLLQVRFKWEVAAHSKSFQRPGELQIADPFQHHTSQQEKHPPITALHQLEKEWEEFDF